MRIKVVILKHLLLTIFILLNIFIISSCQKELSYEGGGETPGIAAFSLIDNTGGCPAISVKGDYRAGIPLSNNNGAAVAVSVTSSGAYTITSDTLNGMSFYASGMFASAGTQAITLSASGIPAKEGSFLFTLKGSNCHFNVTVAPKPAGTAVFTYDGAPSSCTNISRGGNFVAGIPLTEKNAVRIDVNVVVPGTYSVTTTLINGFLFSGTGELSTAGYGVVTLTAIGTPVTDGIFIFTPPNGCPFQISVDP